MQTKPEGKNPPIEFANNGEEIKIILKRFAQQDGIKSVLMIIANENHPKPEELNPILKLFPKPIIGGVFPEIIVKGIRKKSGCLVFALPFKLETLLFNFDEPVDSYLPILEEIYSVGLQEEKEVCLFLQMH